MKKFSFLFSLLFFTGLLISSQSFAQGVVATESTATLFLGTDFNLEATNYNFVDSGSGNYTINATFYLTPGNPYIPEKGTTKVELAGALALQVEYFPYFIQLFSVSEATINKHGKCHVVFHFKNTED